MKLTKLFKKSKPRFRLITKFEGLDSDTGEPIINHYWQARNFGAIRLVFNYHLENLIAIFIINSVENKA